MHDNQTLERRPRRAFLTLNGYLYQALSERAAAANRTLAQQIKVAVRYYLHRVPVDGVHVGEGCPNCRPDLYVLHLPEPESGADEMAVIDGRPPPHPAQSATGDGAGEAIAEGTVRVTKPGERGGSPGAQSDGTIAPDA